MAARLVFPGRVVGTVYACLFSSGIVGTLVVNLALFAPHYDAVGRGQGLEHGCAGPACYRPTSVVVAAANAVGVATGLVFHVIWMRQQHAHRRSRGLGAAAGVTDDPPVSSAYTA